MNSVGINNSPAATQINEAIKNVASMNTKVGGKRKTRKSKNRKQTRKNRKARKSTRRMKGGLRANDYTDCSHIRTEYHKFPSLLIRIKKDPTRRENENEAGPAKPRKFYDCIVIGRDKYNGKKIYQGRSCENARFDDMEIHYNMIESIGNAHTVDDIISWCCEQSG